MRAKPLGPTISEEFHTVFLNMFAVSVLFRADALTSHPPARRSTGLPHFCLSRIRQLKYRLEACSTHVRVQGRSQRGLGTGTSPGSAVRGHAATATAAPTRWYCSESRESSARKSQFSVGFSPLFLFRVQFSKCVGALAPTAGTARSAGSPPLNIFGCPLDAVFFFCL